MMTDELAVVGLVRARAQLAHSGDGAVSDRAAGAAVRAFAAGASVGEATDEGRRVIEGGGQAAALRLGDPTLVAMSHRPMAVAS